MTIASHFGPGLKSQPGCRMQIFFSLIFVRIHTNEFIQLLYKSCSTNSYTVWFLYQFIHFLYELYSTNSYNEPRARAARAKPEHTSCPDQAAPGCSDIRVVLTPLAAAHPLRFHCAATALPLRWLKLGKIGNHLTQRACSSPSARTKKYLGNTILVRLELWDLDSIY